jgi:hypothetical protein
MGPVHNRNLQQWREFCCPKSGKSCLKGLYSVVRDSDLIIPDYFENCEWAIDDCNPR